MCCAHLFGWSLRLGMPSNSPCKVDIMFLFMVLDPTDSRATTSCCSRRNAWKPRIHPRRRLSAFGDLSLKLTSRCSYLRRGCGAAQCTYRKNSSFKHESGINTGDPITELFALPGPLQLLFRQRHILGVRQVRQSRSYRE